MAEVIRGHLYDFPKYYELVFGSDCQAELRFLKACFRKHAGRPVKRLFEPACGTGRLLVRLARAGYQVAGNDLNPHAVRYCNERFVRWGMKPAAVVGDMSDFRLKRKVDAAFNMINSFRHLPSDQAAANHLHCVAESLHRGGLYVLGMHLTPTKGRPMESESWSARRGHLTVVSHLWTKRRDLRRRQEHIGMSFDVYTPTRHQRIVDATVFRIWTADQFARLLKRVPQLEHVATYDFAYDIHRPIEIDPRTEDVVYVLRKR